MNIKTVLHYYRFNLDKPDEHEAYWRLVSHLEANGLTVFDSISPDHSKWYNETIKPLDYSEIELETEFLFENQWNTAAVKTSETGLRVFDWSEAIYPNKDVREGQWLEQTQEMLAVRMDNLKCWWCGGITPKAKINLNQCPKCDAIGFKSLITGKFTLPNDQLVNGIPHGEIVARAKLVKDGQDG